MKKILPVEELARDSRFVRVQIQDAIMDPRQAKVAERNSGSAKLEPERPAAPDRARQLMHGIFMGELQALEGAGRTTFDFDDEDVPFQLKLDMARQSWDESRHCEISVKLAEHMGTEIGEFSEATFLYEAACAEDALLRLTGVNRALEGLAIDVFNTMKLFGDNSGRVRGLDARRRGHPREDGLRLATPPHRERPRAARACPRVPAHRRQALQPWWLPR
jgi:uncharacterized ferritin-like protein (DUF455 family)